MNTHGSFVGITFLNTSLRSTTRLKECWSLWPSLVIIWKEAKHQQNVSYRSFFLSCILLRGPFTIFHSLSSTDPCCQHHNHQQHQHHDHQQPAAKVGIDRFLGSHPGFEAAQLHCSIAAGKQQVTLFHHELLSTENISVYTHLLCNIVTYYNYIHTYYVIICIVIMIRSYLDIMLRRRIQLKVVLLFSPLATSLKSFSNNPSWPWMRWYIKPTQLTTAKGLVGSE